MRGGATPSGDSPGSRPMSACGELLKACAGDGAPADLQTVSMAMRHPEFFFIKHSTTLLHVGKEPALFSILPRKLYALRGDVSAGYHQQLAASLQAFQPRPWPPLPPQDMEPLVISCRPNSARPPKRPYNTNPGYVPAPPSRPRSQPNAQTARPGSSRRRPETPEVNQGNFDTLHPQIITDLMGKQESPLPCFGDRQVEEEDEDEEEREKDKGGKDDNSTTSGFDSIQSEAGSRSEDGDWGEGEPALGGGERPPLPRVQQLRPEALDSQYVAESRKDLRRFDFDATRVELPPYEFPNPLPKILNEVDLKRCARMKAEWRELLPPGREAAAMSDDVQGLVSRLLDLERLQLDTEDWERGRQRAALARKPPTPGPRAGSARPRDRRCCSSCLQAACVGDCPEKSLQFNVCNRCRQAFCTGTCSDTKYDQRMRQGAPRVDEVMMTSTSAGKTVPPGGVRAPLRSSCSTCGQGRKANSSNGGLATNTAKLLNANSLVLGRPRSSLATFSRGQNSARPSRDLRPQTEEEADEDLSEELQRLGIEPLAARPRTVGGKTWRQRGRNGLLPGKTYFSNRKDSITDIPEAVAREKRRKARTSRPRRPKTPNKS